MLTFTYPWFLVGLAGLGVPVFLHLMNREIPVRLLFPSIRYIRKAQLPREGRQKLRDILVLILRLLLLAAVVLALARPRWHREQPPQHAVTGQGGQTVIFVDTSASMHGWQGVEGLRSTVREALATAPGGTVGLVVSSDRPRVILPPTSRHAAIEQAVAQLEIDWVEGNHVEALSEAAGLFQPGPEARLVIISDLQQSDWQFTHPPAVPPEVQVDVIEVNTDRHANVGISGASVRPFGTDSLRVVAEVRNFGRSPATRKITLRVGTEIFSHQLEIPALQVRRTAFVFPKPDISQAELSLDPDDYRLDDTYRFWVGAFPPVKILAVLPLSQEPGKATELFFLRKALSISEGSRGIDFEVDSVETDVFFALNLDGIQALLLLGAAGYFREPEFALVHSFLERGGIVLCTPGEATAHQFRGLHQHKLLPASFVSMAGRTGLKTDIYGLASVDSESILGEVFANADETDLFLFPIYRYARLKPLENTAVLLKTLDNYPALLEHSVGTGRLFASAFAFEPSWSDFPMTGSFLPLVRELLNAAVPPNYGVRQLVCGQPVVVESTLLDEQKSSGKERAAAIDTSRPTVFDIDGIPHQVNVSRRESILETVTPRDLQRRLTGSVAEGTGRRTAAHASADREPAQIQPLWHYCALAAAFLLLAEGLLTGLFDRRELAERRP